MSTSIRVITLFAVLSIVGCGGSQIRPVESGMALDPANVAIHILPTRPTDVGYAVYNNPAKAVSLAIAITADTISTQRGRALREHMGEFNMHSQFINHLGKALTERGYSVNWANPPIDRPLSRNQSVPRDQQRDGFGLKERYGASPAPNQVQLDYVIQFVGYAAEGVSSDHPLKPTLAVNVRIMSADGRQMLFQNAVHYNPILGGDTSLNIDSDKRFSVADYEALRNADPAMLREALDTALREAAIKLATAL